ncbi:MAG: transglycosylase SLT domain-containing protein, partial [Thermomicrobiales bacterium]
MAGSPHRPNRFATVLLTLLLCASWGTDGALAEPFRVTHDPTPAATAAPEPASPSAQAPRALNSEPSTAALASSADPPATATESAQFIREKPEPREFVNPAGIAPAATAPPTATGAKKTPKATRTPAPAPTVPRLDDPVMQWLPEIPAAAKTTGTPAEIIAGIMRVESQGNPNIISPVGARGQMQIMPDNLLAMGISEEFWHDPATNILAGGNFLMARFNDYGSWENAAGSYFGFGCDIFRTCTADYIAAVMGWAAHYAAIIADPYGSGLAVLTDWSPPPIAPFVEAAPPPLETPSPTPSPSPTPTDEASLSPTSTPASTPEPTTTTPT